MSVQDDLDELLGRYCIAKNYVPAEAINISFYMTEAHNSQFDGCDTCGYGADDPTVTFMIKYELPSARFAYDRQRSIEIEGDPLSFLAQMLAWDEVLNE